MLWECSFLIMTNAIIKNASCLSSRVNLPSTLILFQASWNREVYSEAQNVSLPNTCFSLVVVYWRGLLNIILFIHINWLRVLSVVCAFTYIALFKKHNCDNTQKSEALQVWCNNMPEKSLKLKNYLTDYCLIICALGPKRLPPGAVTTFTNRRLYWILFFARPVASFFFSCFSTFGVWFLTFPARAKEPWTLPPPRRRRTRCRVDSFWIL